jgi:hypothetical protein
MQQLAEGDMQTGTESENRDLNSGFAKWTGRDENRTVGSQGREIFKRHNGSRTSTTGGF